MVVEAALMLFRMEHTLDTSSMDILLCKGQLFKEYDTIRAFPHHFGHILDQLNCSV
jgi:hypothetical protein